MGGGGRGKEGLTDSASHFEEGKKKRKGRARTGALFWRPLSVTNRAYMPEECLVSVSGSSEEAGRGGPRGPFSFAVSHGILFRTADAACCRRRRPLRLCEVPASLVVLKGSSIYDASFQTGRSTAPPGAIPARKKNQNRYMQNRRIAGRDTRERRLLKNVVIISSCVAAYAS